MDTKVKESFGWAFIIDIAVLGNKDINSFKNMTLKAIFYMQDRITEKIELDMQGKAMGGILGGL